MNKLIILLIIVILIIIYKNDDMNYKEQFKITNYKPLNEVINTHPDIRSFGPDPISDIRVVNNTLNGGKFDYYFNKKNEPEFSTTKMPQINLIDDTGLILKITTDDEKLITISTDDYKHIPNILVEEQQSNNIFTFSNLKDFIKVTYVPGSESESVWLKIVKDTMNKNKEQSMKLAAQTFFNIEPGYSIFTGVQNKR